MKRIYQLVIFILLIAACKERVEVEKQYEVRVDVRMGTNFYSIFIKKDGRAIAIKGLGSPHYEPFRIQSSATSSSFKLDSVNKFFESLNKIKADPISNIDNNSDFPRVEIYYDKNRIYDVNKWNELFWELFNPIMRQIPKGYNPFRVRDNPF